MFIFRSTGLTLSAGNKNSRELICSRKVEEEGFSGSRSVCGKTTWSYSKLKFAGPGEEVTCQDCRDRISCDHNWILKGIGYHGSSKGEHYYRCLKCGLSIDLDSYDSITKVLRKHVVPKIIDYCSKEQLDKIIFGDFSEI